MSSNDFDTSKPLATGKTKTIFASKSAPADLVLIRSFDALTAGNGQRKSEVAGKAAVATRTTANVFELLNAVGCKTHFVRREADENEFVARKCEMIPIEWVARRIATGSFLKRNPGVKEGHNFANLKIETFFKDDANEDPQWSDEQILAAEFTYADGKRRIGQREIATIKRWTSTIFRVLERAWRLQNCVLVDMKIEFGVVANGDIILADVVDNDSWRVWPGGDRRLQLDKQAYRDLKEVTDGALLELKKNYELVADITAKFASSTTESTIVIVMGSAADLAYADKIEEAAKKLGIDRVQKRICSAHKSTAETLDLIGDYEGQPATIIIAVAGRSNGLGPVISANSSLPVINAPPLCGEWADKDVWSSLRMPSGIGCSTVLGADEAALCAAKILASNDHLIFSKIICLQTNNVAQILEADNQL